MTTPAVEQYWCERCGGTIAATCRVEYDGKPYHRRCEYVARRNEEYIGEVACSPACKCWPQPSAMRDAPTGGDK